MDDKAFVGLVIAILAVFIYYQWIFVACLLAIVGTGAAVRRQIAVTDKQVMFRFIDIIIVTVQKNKLLS